MTLIPKIIAVVLLKDKLTTIKKNTLNTEAHNVRKKLKNSLTTQLSTLHFKTHSIPKCKFRKILVENTTIIAHEINKLRLQILEALLMKAKQKKKKTPKNPEINKISFENSDNVLLPLVFFCLFLIFHISRKYFRW